MENLLNVPIVPYTRTYGFYTNKGNRIALKLLNALTNVPGYQIKERSTLVDARYFEFKIKTAVDVFETEQNIVKELISFIPDNFPVNYAFDFTGDAPLGFVRSFYIRDWEGNIIIDLYHRIKEARRDGKSADLPLTPQITV